METVNNFTYNIAGHNIKIYSENSTVHLICKVYFHLALTNDDHEYEIHFLNQQRNDNNKNEFKIELDEGFKLFYNSSKKKLNSVYHEGILNDSNTEKRELSILYGNSYNNENLPDNSLGVLNTINWLLEYLGIFRLHSAFVKYKNNYILLTGKGSVGKTTTSLNIAFNDGELISDDIVFIKLKNDKIISYPSPKKVALTSKTISFFKELKNSKKTEILHKYNIDEELLFPNRLKKKGFPNKIIFPSIIKENSEEIRIESIPKIKGFISLLEGEILYPTISKETRENQINIVDLLVRQADCFFSFNGENMKENIDLINNII